MRKFILIIFIITLTMTMFAQRNEQGTSRKFKSILKDMIWSDGDDFWYIGSKLGYERKHYTIGAELMVFTSYYTLFAMHSGFHKFYGADYEKTPQYYVNFGVDYYIIGFEICRYFGKENYFSIDPRFSINWGNISFFCGMSINTEHDGKLKLGLKYSIYIDTIFKKSK